MSRIVDRRDRRRPRVRIGEPDRSLTGAAGLVAVAELDRKLALTAALDRRVAGIKQRNRGLSAGELLVAVASCQLADGDHLVSLDRQRADVAGQRLVAVPTPASTTAAGLARRFEAEHFAGIETAIGEVNERVLHLVGQVRRSALLKQVTLDIDTTDIEVYGSRKQGVAYNYQGQRCGRAHIALWAELGVPIIADLADGRADPRSSRRRWPAHLGRPRLRRRRHRSVHPGQTTCRRQCSGPRHPHLQRPTPFAALPWGTRIRPPQRPLAHPPTHHSKPQQNRRHHQSGARPDPFRARPPHVKVAEITSVGVVVRIFAARGNRSLGGEFLVSGVCPGSEARPMLHERWSRQMRYRMGSRASRSRSWDAPTVPSPRSCCTAVHMAVPGMPGLRRPCPAPCGTRSLRTDRRRAVGRPRPRRTGPPLHRGLTPDPGCGACRWAMAASMK